MAYAIVGNESLIIDMYPTAPKGAGAWPGDPAAWLASTNMPCAKARPVVGRVRLGASPLVWACFGSQAQPVDVRLSRDGHLRGSIGLREVAGWRACRVCPENGFPCSSAKGSEDVQYSVLCIVLRVCVRVRHFSPQSHLGAPSNSPGNSTR